DVPGQAAPPAGDGRGDAHAAGRDADRLGRPPHVPDAELRGVWTRLEAARLPWPEGRPAYRFGELHADAGRDDPVGGDRRRRDREPELELTADRAHVPGLRHVPRPARA